MDGQTDADVSLGLQEITGTTLMNSQSIKDELLMKGEQVVIPPSCRDSIIDDLHKSHAGINKALSLARMCVYWHGMEADVTDYIKRCLTCIKCSNLHSHRDPAPP